jgi:hypothetical protein
MNRLAHGLIWFTVCLPPGAAVAADFDGSKLLICAPTEAVDLRPGADLVRERPADIGAPSFLRVDIANKKITGPKRVTPITFIERNDKQILLQGTEMGFGWTLALDQQLGEMTLTFVDRTRAVVLTGRCTPA